jgi:hypothetical protein
VAGMGAGTCAAVHHFRGDFVARTLKKHSEESGVAILSESCQ